MSLRRFLTLFSLLLVLTYGVGFNMLASYNLQSTFSSYGFYNATLADAAGFFSIDLSGVSFADFNFVLILLIQVRMRRCRADSKFPSSRSAVHGYPAR